MKQRQINFLHNKFYSQFAVFFILVLALAGIFVGANLVSSGIDTKNSVIGSASEAFKHLQEAQDLVAQGNFADSQKEFEYAKNNFLSAQGDLNSLGVFLNSLTVILPKQKAAANVLSAGVKITDAGIDLNKFHTYSEQIKFSAQGFESPDGFYGTSNAAIFYLNKAKQELNDARTLLDQVDPNQLPADFQTKFVDSKNKLDFASNGISTMSSLLSLFQSFIGADKKTVLVLFENNNELRPTGGFIGTYGIFKFEDGKIISQKISSIYDLDGQLNQKIAPPGQFSAMTDHWGLRDSNWFPDFAESAKKASMFYEKSAGETPDAVIALTPDIFVDLLQVSGPIEFPKYGITLSADNFREQIQENTSVSYDKSANAPKQLLADFEPLLLQKLSDLPSDKTSAVLSALFKNLSSKNILFYDRDPGIEANFAKYNWAGTISDTNLDYLSIVNANLGGKKTDLSMLQKIQVQSELQVDGSVINTVTYTRTHQTGLYDNAKNIDYIRFLVPEGSALISAKGFTKKPYYAADGSAYPASSVPFQVDADLKKIDASTKVDAASGTAVSEESGKTVFGNWIDLDPGDSATITLQYKLPYTLADSRKQSFIFQKQPGVAGLALDYQFIAHRAITWVTPSDAEIQDRTVQLRKTADQDIFVGIVTQ